MTQTELNRQVLSMLTADSELAEMVNGVFPIVAEQGTDLPFITYRTQSSEDTRHKDGVEPTRAVVRIVVAARFYKSLMEISERVREVMETDSDYTLTGWSEDYNDEAQQTYLNLMDFSVLL